MGGTQILHARIRTKETLSLKANKGARPITPSSCWRWAASPLYAALFGDSMNNNIIVTSLLLIASFCAHASAEQPSEGKNALDPKLPQIEITYKCLDFPEEIMTVTNQCLKEVKALKSIQCRADWLMSQKLVEYFDCAAKNSTGDFNAYDQNKADDTSVVRRN